MVGSVGKSISAIYDYPIQEFVKLRIRPWQKHGFQPGDFRLVDGNGDGKYTIADKKLSGDFSPKYSWNLRNDFKIYKNFDFSFTYMPGNRPAEHI